AQQGDMSGGEEQEAQGEGQEQREATLSAKGRSHVRVLQNGGLLSSKDCCYSSRRAFAVNHSFHDHGSHAGPREVPARWIGSRQAPRAPFPSVWPSASSLSRPPGSAMRAPQRTAGPPCPTSRRARTRCSSRKTSRSTSFRRPRRASRT